MRRSSTSHETLSGESSDVWPGRDDSSGESKLKRPRDKTWSGESTNVKKKSDGCDTDFISSSDGSQSPSRESVSETTSNSDVSVIPIHSLLVECKQLGQEREKHQDPNRDRYTSDRVRHGS